MSGEQRLVSVVVPAFNEGETVGPVVQEALGILRGAGFRSEAVVVDDGSSDGTAAAVEHVAAADPAVHLIRLRRNFGKSAALSAGLAAAQGEIVVLIDADGQDDAASIPKLIVELDGGTDLVTGRRALRRDRFIKRWTSKVYNAVTAWVSGVHGQDFNSGLKVMRAEVARDLTMYGELHRYIPVLAFWSGFRVAEVDVPHHPRRAGESKFGHSRFWRGFIDLLTVKFLTTYRSRPLHLFGMVGGIGSLLGVAILGWLTVDKLVLGHTIGNRPLLFLGLLLVIVGVQIVSLGLLAELIVHLNQHGARQARGAGPDRTHL